MYHFSIPTPKQQNPSASQPQLRRSKRSLKTHGFLSRDQLNSVTPSSSPRVGCAPPRVDPSLSLAFPELHAVLHPISGDQCEYRHLSSGKVPGQCPLVWKHVFANELGRLSQGTRDIKGTDIISFIPFRDFPRNKTPTYGRIVSDIKAHKQEVERVRLTVGGDRITCSYDISTPVADLTTVKIHLNSVISTPKAKVLTTDIRNFYLNNTLPAPEYIRLPISIIPVEIINKYNLLSLVHNGFVNIKINKGMYGLPQAGKITHNELVRHLAPFGYHPTTHTPGLFTYVTRPISFVLTIYDFGIKYTNITDANHLLVSLRRKYDVTTDWSGFLYCGITLKWDYIQRTVQLSMPGYIANVLQKYNHPAFLKLSI